MKLSRLFAYVLPIFTLLYYVWTCLQGPLYLFTQFCVICGLLVISWTIGYYFYDRFSTEKILPNGKIVLITGCDSGFGHKLAVQLDQYGFNVFAGVLSPDSEGAQALQQKCSARLRIIRMDVTKQDEVELVVEEIRKTGKPLWALVNNAGIGYTTFFDWGNDVDEYRRILDVTLFGVIRVTKYCMPLLRESQGRIVNVTSLAGRITLGCGSHYAMAKHSIRVFSDAIRREFLQTKQQIQVITIEPTYYQTEIINKNQSNQDRIISQTPESILNEYDIEACKRFFAATQKLIDKMARTNLNEVTDAIASGVLLKEPKQFYRCCGYLDLILWVKTHAPEVVVDYFLLLLQPGKY